ncbi:23S rRNA pseudouridylate synthase B [Caulobacter radicis]|uniref:pseudouridine synthase n=1 Tax=Caulobacter radicis TaxID=2172650 RepID=UPI000D57B6A8|nr:23S rRNA pseudouridylate synthase B [Caulobacter radicis]
MTDKYQPALHDAVEHDPDAEGGERVAKALARAGVASRREVERLIEAGKVVLNGQVLTTPAVRVFPGDLLVVDGKLVEDRQPTRLFRYHKPTGLVTTHNDPGGRPTVFGALPNGLPRVISVGRLDLNSEGLLLLTNDGELSRALEMPQNAWTRRYRARAFGHATQETLDRLKDGTTIEGVRYGPIEARLDKAQDKAGGGRNVWITVTLSEGKNREVRKVLESVGLKVNRLIRLSYGPFALGTLQAGQVEEVGPRVIRELLAGVIADENMPQGDKPQFVGVADPLYAPGVAKDGERLRGGEVQRRAPSGRAPQIATPKVEEPKKVYKAGWAKAKIRTDGHKSKTHKPKSIDTKFVTEAPGRGKGPAKPGAKGAATKGAAGKPGARPAGKIAPQGATRGNVAPARSGKPADFKGPRATGGKPAPRGPKR